MSVQREGWLWIEICRRMQQLALLRCWGSSLDQHCRFVSCSKVLHMIETNCQLRRLQAAKYSYQLRGQPRLWLHLRRRAIWAENPSVAVNRTWLCPFCELVPKWPRRTSKPTITYQPDLPVGTVILLRIWCCRILAGRVKCGKIELSDYCR